MTYPEVQFVAAPEDGAAVLFDFNDNFGDAPAQIIAGTFTLGTPSIEGDPDGLGVQYGAREVGFSLLIYGNRQAARETQALLARTFMLRRRGWLRVQMDEFSAPVWLRTYTPTPAELDFTLVSLDDVQPDAWQLEVTVAAEPFIRGERVELWSGTINNNPAALSNPMTIPLPDVVGDAPAPLRISAEFDRPHDQSDILWSTAAVPASHTPIVWQVGSGDGWGVSPDTNAPELGAAYSNGSFRRVTFSALEFMSARLAGPAPTSVTPGRYRVFLRAAITSGIFKLRLGYRTNLDEEEFAGSRIATIDLGDDNALYATWVDLGEFDFPTRRGGVDIPEVAGVPKVTLHAERAAGVSDLLLDVFVLVPVDISTVTTLEPWEKSDVLVSEFAARGPQSTEGEVQVWDGDAEMSVRISPAGVVDSSIHPANRGRFPSVRPGVSNHLTLIGQTRPTLGAFETTANSDSVDDTAAVSVSYQPRWLWLGDA